MNLLVDQRTVHFQRDDEALAAVDARREAWLDQQLELARLFCRIDRKAAFAAIGCGSVSELALRRGYEGRQARELCQLGYALAGEPALERLLRENQVPFASACAIGRIHSEPALLAEGDTWLDWARFERLCDLRRRIRRRVESVRQGRPADVTFTAQVTEGTAENMGRCRRLASQKAGRLLTNGQLLDLLSTGYLLEHDVTRQVGRARRLPPTAQRPFDRTVPAEVRRALAERSGGLCEFGSCERPAAETCHLVPHREGSGREAEDLVEGCRPHHKAYDAGLLRFLGWTRAPDPLGAGLPIFQVVETGETLRPKPRPQTGSYANHTPFATPGWLRRALGTRLRRRLERGTGSRAPPGR